ncbi:hypothetical protein SPRG_00302 [Saprolegnia parasitica CBS 223.65]|uniref:Uncharacterized protein n=1 Tax=Saprolegnia parasitica (strain CBS 223.65) TaxID=695850 RepID=A0A067CXL3_SAPPC|nr:hypothetical protein SPRG_00302 [Saprolegnia parasitica CBS 223.65]KDO35454.1 hypothetical protein SPRG_00302 [Saprolegnia parasitica CBS 223.65]|eukprot:XP_012193794.1 hypothetical protein SPRG_00302 [Saprolegnia parasitica CBS 223.65]
MADDDPYNFTIDIAGASRAKTKYDDESNEASEDRSDASLSPPKAKAKTKVKAAPAKASSQSNALDKAKNFLSKYSKPIEKPVRRRVTLDDSDEDEASEASVEPPTTKKAPVSRYDDDVSDSLDAPPTRSKVTLDDISMDESEDEPVRQPTIAAPKTVPTVQQVQSTRPAVATRTADDSDDDDPPSFHDASEDDQPPTRATAAIPVVTPPKQEEESDAYDDDDVVDEASMVEEEDEDVDDAPAKSTVVPTKASEQPTYDYSMEFSQDDNDDGPKATTMAPSAVQPVASEMSDGDNYGDESFAASEPVLERVAKEPSEDNYGDESFAASEPAAPAMEETPAYDDESFQEASVDLVVAPAVVVPPSVAPVPAPAAMVEPASSAPTLPTPRPLVEPTVTLPTATISTSVPAAPPVETSRPRVMIVREYELPERPKAEMKDASTQYTGNHVQIQADFGPQSAPSPPLDPPSVPTPTWQPPHETSQASSQFGHAPIPPLLNVSLTGSSVYRHQLAQIQLQIRRKRLETDRLLRESSAFRYTSHDETDKFVSLNRPRKLALWEALMQVDPSMSQEQAMKIEALSKSA